MADCSELLDCPICMEPFNDARFLKCAHSFCLPCIKRLPQKHHSVIICPNCRQETQIHEKGVEALMKNFYVDKFRDIFRKIDKENQRIVNNNEEQFKAAVDKLETETGNLLRKNNEIYTELEKQRNDYNKTLATQILHIWKRKCLILSQVIWLWVFTYIGWVRDRIHEFVTQCRDIILYYTLLVVYIVFIMTNFGDISEEVDQHPEQFLDSRATYFLELIVIALLAIFLDYRTYIDSQQNEIPCIRAVHIEPQRAFTRFFRLCYYCTFCEEECQKDHGHIEIINISSYLHRLVYIFMKIKYLDFSF